MYDVIKKQNGEGFAKAIRNYDSGIFDIPRLDHIVKYAGRYAEPIMQYLISLKGFQIEEQSVHMDPIELLSHAGYDAYVADTLKRQNAIRKYFAPGEELCTFRDPHRFEKYFIINAVRKDVDQIRRKDFAKPEREDEYGTSVLSIQVLKTGGFISIKNRYNHTVPHPDNTLNSNPDNIIPGLSDAIKHHFDVDFSAQQVELPRGYLLINKQIIRFNTERNNVYYAEDFFVMDGKIHEINKGTQVMLGDGLMLDLHKKEVCEVVPNLGSNQSEYDPFIESINEELAGKKLQLSKNPLGGRDIIADGQVVFTVENGDLVNIILPNAKEINLNNRKHLRGNLDFSGVTGALILERADLRAVKSIKPPKQIRELSLAVAKLPAIDLDFSGVTEKLDLYETDLSAVKSIKLPKRIRELSLALAKLPAIDLDFSGITEKLDLDDTDLSAVKSIKLPKKIRELSLGTSILPAIDLDFSGVTEKLDLHYADLSAVKSIKLPKQIRELSLGMSILPAIDLDFSGVTEKLDLDAADLSAVKSIKLPISKARKLIKGIDALKSLIKKAILKPINTIKNQGSENE